MKRILAIVCVLTLLLSICACGSSVSDANNSEQEETNEPSAAENAESTEKRDPEDYSNTIYYVGEDLPDGGYVVTCTHTDYAMRVIIFSGEDTYKAFQNADQFTVGEFSAAVEQHAWANFYLNQDEQAFIGLKKGNVILLDKGTCEFTKHDPNASDTVCSGIYVVGEDFDADKFNIRCVSDYLRVTVFETKDAYLNYHKSSRFTIGEEADAIQANASSTDFIYEGETTYVNLRDGMVLMVEDGIGEELPDSGPVIN